MSSLLAKATATIIVVGGSLAWAGALSAQDVQFVRGDVNLDGSIDVADPVGVLVHLFLPGSGAPCEKAADWDDGGSIDITDAVFGLSFLFRGGPAPPPPFRGCGTDPTADGLGCERTACEGELVRVAARCPPDPYAQLQWAVTSLRQSVVTLDWEIAGSDQDGSLQVPALDTAVLTTARVPGRNELILSQGGIEVARLAQVGVIFSEVMASNADSLADEDGDSSDWIELHLVESPCGSSIDLRNWYLTDDPDALPKWWFPSVTLEAGGYVLVFASGKDRSVAGSELHTNFELSAGGEYLALVAPDAVTIVDEFRPGFPEQLTDVSYGVAQETTKLVRAGDAARYRVPIAADAALGTGWTQPSFAATGWLSGTLGLGFSGVATEGLEVTCVRSRVAVDSLATARSVLSTPASQLSSVTESADFIDYFNTGGSGNYPNDRAFPGLTFADVEDFVVLVTGTILIPEAGQWSFGVNSDDGFGMTLRNGAQTFTMEYPEPRGPADTISVFSLPRAGPYELELVFYERGGGSELELFAARGNHPTFNYDSFRLVGDVANGGLATVGFSGEIGTDVGSRMRGVNASLWIRVPFEVSDPDEYGSLVLRTKYEDGFVAYLNGREVARRNAPASPAWNSAATANRPIEEVSLAEEFPLTSHLDALVSGTNVLAVHGLNDGVSDPDFLIAPELIAASRVAGVEYMETPTPGAFNISGSVDFVRSVELSVERGFFDAPFSLSLSTPTQGATIRYTLDGSTPTAATGTVYGGPLTIDRTRVVRAAGFRTGFLPSRVKTTTYIFPSDVIRQSPTGAAPGAGWPTGSVNGQVLDYGMDPDIVNNARWSGLVEDALLAVPTLSLVTDVGNLFDASSGIYVNAWNDGLAWERRTSVELLEPDGSPGFGLDAGLRIRGAFSRSGGNPKHSLRLFFRNAYGAGRLEHALFGGEGVDEFDKIDLRTSQNYSWAYEGSAQNTMLREVFSRDAQRDMGEPYTRSRYYHLYLNGQYWGLYQTQERVDSDFAQSYFGGREEDYDVIKNDSSGSRALQADGGTMDAYRRLYDAAVAGFASNTAYLRVQGLRSDGSPDPAGERLLDVRNLMDYMSCTYYTGDPDAPVSCWAHISNNNFAVYNRTRKDGFKWFRHDAEHSLGANGGLYDARILTDPTDRSIGEEWSQFNPAWLHVRLTENAEYALAFADRVNAQFSNGGLFTSGANIERWLDRAAQIELAIVAESARWGDSKTHPPRTRDDWQAQVDSMAGTYFPQRTQIVIDQMRSVGMFPALAIVSFNQHGGPVDPGFQVRMSQGNGTAGTIYYTLDGTDPRRWGGAVDPGAATFQDDSTPVTFIPIGSTWRYKDDGSDQGVAWRAQGFNDAGWAQGPAQLGYGDGDEATVVSYGTDAGNKHPTTYFRRTFTVADASEVLQLAIGLVRDDGAVVWLNGTEVVRTNLPAGTIDYLTLAQGAGVPVGGTDESAFNAFELDPGLLVDGANTIAVEIHQESRGSTDISFDLELTGRVAGTASDPIILSETTTVKARVYQGGTWGALTEARFTIGLEGLVINEVLASSATVLEDPDEPWEYPDWIELWNGTTAAVDLGGMYLTDDPQDLTKWQIAPGVRILSGQYLIFFADDDGTQGAFHTNYKLSAKGESLVLVDRDGVTILDSVVFDAQTTDVSWGRYPDGATIWGFHPTPTPGAANGPHAP